MGAKKDLQQALILIRDLVDEDDCWLDHDGGCQAHGYISLQHGQTCPQQDAKDMLEKHGVK